MARRHFIAGLLALISASGVAPRPAEQDKRLSGWREDLHALVETLPKKHKDPFTIVTREKFDAAAKDLDGRLDKLTDWQIYLEFKRLAAMIGDSHTTVGDSKGRYPRRAYPFSVVLLSDGVFVVAASEAQRSLLGRRLVKIADTDAGTAVRRLGEIIPHENDSWLRHMARQWLISPEIHFALGLIKDPDNAPFTFRDAAGAETTVTLAPMAKGERQSALALKPDELPLSRRPRQSNYGSAILPDSRDLYVWYDKCQDAKDKTVSAFALETLSAIEREKPERVIIDLRQNDGGNSALIQPLVFGLALRKELAGKLFVLIGRGTFSSGLWAAQDLKTRAKGVLVGEPTGGKPNSFGEVRSFDLPNSGLTVYYSTKLWKRDPTADPRSLMPDVPVAVSSTDFFSQRDAAIDAVRAYKPQ